MLKLKKRILSVIMASCIFCQQTQLLFAAVEYEGNYKGTVIYGDADNDGDIDADDFSMVLQIANESVTADERTKMASDVLHNGTVDAADALAISKYVNGSYIIDPIASGYCGTNVKWSLSADYKLTISGTGKMTDFTDNSMPWYNYKGNIKSVEIDKGVTRIGNFAFYGCRALTSVTISDGVTSIGSSAFSGCRSLTSITIPDSVTSIGYSAFAKCRSLTSITIPNRVTGIGYSAFYGCSGLTSITIPDSVTGIGTYAFSACSGLTSITIPDSVTSIGSYAFNGCSGLTSITIPDSVTSVGSNAFSGCNSLKSITISNGVMSIAPYVFEGCSGLTSVTIPDSVTSIGNAAFYCCNGLTSITIPDSVTSIGNVAFHGCSSLTSITIPDSVTSISSDSFNYVKNATIYCVKGSTADDTSLYDSTCTIEYIVPESDFTFDSSTGTITKYTGSGGDIEIPQTIGGVDVRSIGINAFYGCEGLESVIIPGSVTNVGDFAFALCHNLKNIVISDGVKSIGDSAFFSCGIESVNIPKSVISMAGNPFGNCTNLNSINVAGNNMVYKSIGGIVYSKDDNEIVAYPAGKSGSFSIPTSVTFIGAHAFEGCVGLSNVTIPTGVVKIGVCAFGLCDGLTSINIPNGVTDIDAWAISNCSGLKSITIPDSVTNIGVGAFSVCGALTDITLPNGVTDISDELFYYCNSLKNITITGNVTGVGEYAFEYVKNAVIYCKKNSAVDDISLYDSSCTIKYIDTYTISYDSNGGSGTFEPQIKGYYEELKLNSSSPTRAGYLFKGWTKSASATTAEYQPGDTFNENVDTTLYAVWQEIPTVSAPTVTVTNIDGGKRITITSATSGSTIYYTLDGSTPTVNSTKYTGAIDIKYAYNNTVKAIAVKADYDNSSVTSKPVSVTKLSSPTASLADGTVLKAAANITLSAENGTIYYTLDGTTPSTNSNVYTSALTVQPGTTLKTLAATAGCATSDTAEYNYLSKVYTIGVDNYSFTNDRVSFGYPVGYQISPAIFEEVLGTGRGIQEWKNWALWRGSCYGLSATSALFYNGTLNLSDYTETKNLYSLSSWEHYSEFTTLIEKYQVVQFDLNLVCQRIGNDGNMRFGKKSHVNDKDKNDFSNIISALKNIDEEPIVIVLADNAGHGHAILPYRVEEITAGTEYDVYVYDSQYPQNDNCIIKLYKDDFEYGRYTNFSYNTVSDIINAMNSHTVNNNVMSVVINSASEDIVITDGNDNEIEELDMYRADYTDTDMEYAGFVEYNLPVGNYVIKNNGDSLNGFSVSVSAYNDYKIAEIQSFDDDDEISIINNAGNQTFALQIKSNAVDYMKVFVFNNICGGKSIETKGTLLSVSENSAYWLARTNGSTVYTNGEDKGNSISKVEAAYGGNIQDGISLEMKNVPSYSMATRSISGDCSLYVYNNTNELTSGRLHIGIYSKDGKKQAATLYTSDVLLTPGTNYINMGTVNYGLPNDHYVLKAFLWDSYDSMQPKTDCISETIK